MGKEDSMHKISKIFGESQNPATGQKEDWLAEYEGQLAVDVYQTPQSIIIKAPIAGVKPEDLDVSITDNVVIIRGERKEEEQIRKEDYFAQECYWGTFSRSINLPKGLNTEETSASLKNGVLKLTIPKSPSSVTRKVQIQAE